MLLVGVSLKLQTLNLKSLKRGRSFTPSSSKHYVTTSLCYNLVHSFIYTPEGFASFICGDLSQETCDGHRFAMTCYTPNLSLKP